MGVMLVWSALYFSSCPVSLGSKHADLTDGPSGQGIIKGHCGGGAERGAEDSLGPHPFSTCQGRWTTSRMTEGWGLFFLPLFFHVFLAGQVVDSLPLSLWILQAWPSQSALLLESTPSASQCWGCSALLGSSWKACTKTGSASSGAASLCLAVVPPDFPGALSLSSACLWDWMVELKPDLVGSRFWPLLWAPVLYIHILRGKILSNFCPVFFPESERFLSPDSVLGPELNMPPVFSLFVPSTSHPCLFGSSLWDFTTFALLPSLRRWWNAYQYGQCNGKSCTNLSLPSGLEEGVCVFVQTLALDSFVFFSCVSNTLFSTYALIVADKCIIIMFFFEI